MMTIHGLNDRPTKVTNVLLDGDILAYRSAYSCKGGSVDDVCQKIDELVSFIEQNTVVFRDSTNFEVYTTGKGNYRNDYAVTTPYKGNRTNTEKPEHLETAYWYLEHKYNSVKVDGREADDIISTRVREINSPETTVIASVDKDFRQCNCWLYNPTKDEFTFSTKFSGLQYFYEQILTGDTADNIKGIKGVGPVKAWKLIEGCRTERELYEVCVKAYSEDNQDGVARVQENGILLWLQDYEGQVWEPPLDTKNPEKC